MAAYDIQKHFSGLRVQSARRKGRPDPFATGFEDDSDDDFRKSRPKTKAPPVQVQAKPSPIAPCAPATSTTTNKSPSVTSRPKDHVAAAAADDDDNFLLEVTAQKKAAAAERRPSPNPPALAPKPAQRVIDGTGRRGSLPGVLSDQRKAALLAAGPLAYLDDSDEEDNISRPSRRTARNQSPAPPQTSDVDPHARASTPSGSRLPQTQSSPDKSVVIPRHTVASPFAGTKYLQDSDSESDEEAVASRKGSAEEIPAIPDSKQHHEVQRVDKGKLQNGGGVSWRAFSAGRAEQRNAELEALAANLRKRGRSIQFSPTVRTDDGRQISLAPTNERNGPLLGRKPGKSRAKSPPRRASDTKPIDEDEMADREPGGPVRTYDPTFWRTNPFSASTSTARAQMPQIMIASQTSASTKSPDRDLNLWSPITSPDTSNRMLSSIDSLSKLTVSPQTIPEGRTVDHAMFESSPVMSPMTEDYDPLSTNSSMRSLRSRRIPTSKRSSRRSTSAATSASPAHAFLANWGRGDAEDTSPEPKPDDEGQAIGLNNEYIIGRTISQGGFGIVKEVHSLDDHGNRTLKAVKIVHKAISGANDAENERVQQEIEHEVSIWRYLNHRHVLPLHAVYETDYATFCVMDLNVGGTLFDLVRKSRASAASNEGRKGLPPHLAKSYAYQLACALRYLHEDIRVCHRDVKLENCLIDMSGPDAEAEGGNLRLCDFGLADFLHSEGMQDGSRTPQRIPSQRSLSNDMPMPTASSIIGTLEYASPKGLSANRKLFETAGDVWAFGVIVYALCTGHLPFRHTIPSKTVELILRADWDEDALRHAAAGGEDVIDLVRGCLERDNDIRFTISDALRSPWFEGCREAYDEEAISPWG